MHLFKQKGTVAILRKSKKLRQRSTCLEKIVYLVSAKNIVFAAQGASNSGYEWLGLTVTIHGSAITFAKLPTLKRVSCNIAKCSTPLRIGNAGLDIYSGYDAKQPKNVSGYSSPMLNDFTGTDKVYIVRGYTYLHKGIDGPAWLTYQQFELDSFTNMLFLFCGRHRGHIKGLYLEKDGIIMLYKRLGQGVVPVDAFGI